jgi:hypothetical protein
MMARDIRIAGYDPSELADAGIVSAGPNSINFTFDINDGIDNDADGTVDEIGEPIINDGDVTDANENITYSIDTTDADNPKLVRNAGGGDQPVADYIDEVGRTTSMRLDLLMLSIIMATTKWTSRAVAL